MLKKHKNLIQFLLNMLCVCEYVFHVFCCCCMNKHTYIRTYNIYINIYYTNFLSRRVNNTYDGIMYRDEIVSFQQEKKNDGACCTAYYQLCTSLLCLKLLWFLILHFNINRKNVWLKEKFGAFCGVSDNW